MTHEAVKHSQRSKVPQSHSNLTPPQCKFHGVQAKALHQPSIFSSPNSCKKNTLIFKGPDLRSLQHSSSTRASMDFPTSARSCGRSKYLRVEKLKPLQVLHTIWSWLHIYRTSRLTEEFHFNQTRNARLRNVSVFHETGHSRTRTTRHGPRLICIDLKAPPQSSPVLSGTDPRPIVMPKWIWWVHVICTHK